MAKRECHGCEGKGWVLLIKSERTTPFLSQVTREPMGNAGVSTREYEPAICILCKGTGIALPEYRAEGGQKAAD